MWDNDTPIQVGEKEGQTDISSALKRFYDHYSGYWENLKFGIFWLLPYRFTGLVYINCFVEVKKFKIWHCLNNRGSSPKTFLGPN